MLRSEWLRKKFTASVQQGIGAWMDESEDPELGSGIFEWQGGPSIRVFERGLTYDGDETWRLLFDELTSIDSLDLAALMRAQKAPAQAVRLVIRTSEGSRAVILPLFVYTTLSAVLNAIVEGNQRGEPPTV